MTFLRDIAIAPSGARSAGAHPHSVFYDAVGPDLAWWQVDIGNATLTRQGSVALPALVQYAWRHPAKPVLYVASSNFVPIGKPDG